MLADELIPGGEALVRNLLAGRRVLSSLGATSQPVLYCPDAFGHPAALPELASGFGLPLIIAWRGFGSRRWPSGDTFEWRAPSGASSVLFHLAKSGYEFGSALPHDDAGARERWARIRAELDPRSTSGVLLIQNGADHHARQRHYREALAVLERAAAPAATAKGSSMRRFADELLASVSRRRLPIVEGELRDSYGYTWTLQGTFATRAHQKRMNAHAERSLLREAEPFASIARARCGVSRLATTRVAWRSLLEAQPHDTLCGCSIDDVARAMDVRVADALDQARGISEDALLDIVAYDREQARIHREDWKPCVLVRNPSARSRGGVAVVDLELFVADIPVGPGSTPISHSPVRRSVPIPSIDDALWVQPLGNPELTNRRIESPRHYPDNDLVAHASVALWIDPIPGFGTAMRRVDPPWGSSSAPRPLSAPRLVRAPDRGPTGMAIDNGIVRLQAYDGVLSFEHLASNQRVDDIVILEDRVDRGDLYTPSIGNHCLKPRLADARVLHGGPLMATWRLRWLLEEATRADAPGGAWLDVDFSIRAESPVLHMRVRGANRRLNHRLRLGIRTPIKLAAVWADAAFGAQRRTPIRASDEDEAMEIPPRTAPLHRYVSLFSAHGGATLFSDGLAEYEAASDGTIWVTLLRSVGELSRNDLPERPGHAGWPAHTPLAQSLGPFDASLGLLLHGPRSDDTIALIEETCEDVLTPLTGSTLRSALHVAAPTPGAELIGRGLAFSTLKESEDGAGIIARCVNLLEHEVDGAWQFGFPIREALRARLDETPREALPHEHDRVTFRAGPREVVTILVRV